MGCFKLAFLFGGFPFCPPSSLQTPVWFPLDFWPLLLSLPGESEVLHTCKEILLRRQGFLNIQRLLLPINRLNSRERGCVWSVCLLGWLVCFFLILPLSLMVYPCFLLSVKPGLIAKPGKPASLPLGSWGRTDSGCRCLHVHGGKAWRNRLLSCLTLARLPLPLQQAGKELQAELPDKLNVATSKDVLGKAKMKGNNTTLQKSWG